MRTFIRLRITFPTQCRRLLRNVVRCCVSSMYTNNLMITCYCTMYMCVRGKHVRSNFPNVTSTKWKFVVAWNESVWLCYVYQIHLCIPFTPTLKHLFSVYVGVCFSTALDERYNVEWQSVQDKYHRRRHFLLLSKLFNLLFQ